MGFGTSYSGASGRLYHYVIFSADDLHNLPTHGGCYIFALNDAARTPVFIEATNSVRASVMRQGMAEWNVAKAEHGAKLVLIHFEEDQNAADRQAEKADFIACFYPPMNPNPDRQQ